MTEYHLCGPIEGYSGSWEHTKTGQCPFVYPFPYFVLRQFSSIIFSENTEPQSGYCISSLWLPLRIDANEKKGSKGIFFMEPAIHGRNNNSSTHSTRMPTLVFSQSQCHHSFEYSCTVPFLYYSNIGSVSYSLPLCADNSMQNLIQLTL